MTSFDALRAAHVGAVSYICKENIPPSELTMCSPLTSDALDRSRYGNNGLWMSPITYLSGYLSFPMANISSISWGSILNFSSNTFSFECFINARGNYGACINIGGLTIESYSSGSGPTYYIRKNGGHINIFVTDLSVTRHFAVVGDSGTLKVYNNGSLFATTTTSDLSSNIVLTNGMFSDVRLVTKNLANGSSYVIPNSPFTGYEPL